MKKIYLFILFFFLFLLLTLSLFVIGKKIISGYVVSKENETEYASTTAGPSDKDCFNLDDGRVVCRIGVVEIFESSVVVENFSIGS